MSDGGSLTLTFDSGDGPTLSGFNLSADGDARADQAAERDRLRRGGVVHRRGRVARRGSSNASGRATATVSGCVDPNGDAEFVVSLAEFGFGGELPNGQRRITIGARAGQTAGQPAAACTLPAGATVTPGGAVVRLRTDNGVASVFVDGQMRFNDPLMFMPNVGVTGSFSETGVGTLTVDGSVNLLGSTLRIGSTVTVTESNGATGTLTMSTPPGQPLTLGGWSIGGTLSLTLTTTAATVGIANGTLTIPGAGTHSINGSISMSGEGSFSVRTAAEGTSPRPVTVAVLRHRVVHDPLPERCRHVPSHQCRSAAAGRRHRVSRIRTCRCSRSSNDGTLNIDTAGFTFAGPGGFAIVVPPMSLRSGPSMGGIRLEVGEGQLTLPGLADGTTGRPTLTVPGFTLDSTLDFERVLVASDLSFGIVDRARPARPRGRDGVYSMRIDPLSTGQPAEVRSRRQ